MANSAPGEWASPSMRVTPPIHDRVMPSTCRPTRRATTAWPSSWSRTPNSNTTAVSAPASGIGGPGVARGLKGKAVGRQTAGDERHHGEQAPVEPHPHAGEPAQADGVVHASRVRRLRRRSTAGLHVGVPGGDGVPLVVALAALGQRQVDLGPPILEVHRQRHQGERVLGGAPAQLVDLAAVQQQLPAPVGVGGTEPGREGVGRHVHAVQPHLAVDDPGVAVPELGLALPQRLDLAAGQHDAGLVGLEDVVVVAGPAVLGNRPAVGALGARLARRATWPAPR